jgi:DNA-binding winged helix-turn-helix (wHTH) protein
LHCINPDVSVNGKIVDQNFAWLLERGSLIQQRLWGGGSFLETERSINTAINKLRVTLRDDSPRFIRTIIGQGYKFIAEVKTTEPVERSNALLAPSMEM